MLNVAVLGKWHVHAWGYANETNTSKIAKVSAVWDADACRGKAWAEELKAEFIPELDEVLARKDIDAVIVGNETTAHFEVINKAALAGKHIFTEKALAPKLSECRIIRESVIKSGKNFVISYPHLGRPLIKFAKKLVDDGVLGKICTVRSRVAHNGVSGNWLPEYWFEEKDAAGGSMMDLGCHPMYLISYFGCKPVRVSGLFNAPFGSKVDENAVATVEFENGTIGIAETGFISKDSPNSFEIYGSEGCMTATSESNIRLSSTKIADIPAYIKENLPPESPSPLSVFLNACANGEKTPAELGIDAACALTELLESAYISDRENRIVTIK